MSSAAGTTLLSAGDAYRAARHRLSRVVARSANAHGHTKPFRHLQQLRCCALRFEAPTATPAPGSSGQRDSRRDAETLHKVIALCEASARELHALVVLTFFMPLALSSLAIVARLHSSARTLIRHAVADHVAASAAALRSSVGAARASGKGVDPAALAATLAARRLPQDVLRTAGWRDVDLQLDARGAAAASCATATGARAGARPGSDAGGASRGRSAVEAWSSRAEDFGQPLTRDGVGQALKRALDPCDKGETLPPSQKKRKKRRKKKKTKPTQQQQQQQQY